MYDSGINRDVHWVENLLESPDNPWQETEHLQEIFMWNEPQYPMCGGLVLD